MAYVIFLMFQECLFLLWTEPFVLTRQIIHVFQLYDPANDRILMAY